MRALAIVAAAVGVLMAAPFAIQAQAAPSGGGGGSMPQSSNRDPARNYQEGVAALQAGDYALAVRKLRDVVEVTPRDPNVNYVYALALIGDNQAGSARRPLERAVAGRNPPPDAFNQLGRLNLQQDRRDDAVAQQAALAAMLAQCDAACGDQRRAQIRAAHAALSQALNPSAAPQAHPAPQSWLIPDTEEGRAAYAEAVGLINTQRFEQALAALDRAEAAIGPHPDILNYRGFASRRLGRYDAALELYAEALALDPNHIGANEYLGELYLEMGRTEDAERQLARLDRLCPFGCAQREELARWIQLASN